MSFQATHEGVPYTLTFDSTTLTIQPESTSTASTTPPPPPPTLPLSSIAYIVPSPVVPTESHPTSFLLVYLTTAPDSTAGPTVHSLLFLTSSASLPSSIPAFSSLRLPPPHKSSGSVFGSTSIIINNASGARTALAFYREVVNPLLKLAGRGVEQWVEYETQKENDGVRIGRQIRSTTAGSGGNRTIIVLGGDGTVHELLNGLLLDDQGKSYEDEQETDLVLLPLGTANALYFHHFPPESPFTPSSTPLSQLYSLLSHLRQSQTLPLSLALNTLTSTSTVPSLTAVVSSSALHACLLLDAEKLRSSMPGVERFKVAAVQNANQWWEGKLELWGNEVSRYDSKTKRLFPVEEGEGRTIEGPFSYFVSALVSRFEPTFVVAPFRSPLSPLAPPSLSSSIDLVVIRPLRDGPTKVLFEQGGKEKEAKEGFVGRVWGVTGGMYDGGKHVDMVDEEGKEVVEYFRAEGFRWTPREADEEKGNLVCLDGALKSTGIGGSLETIAKGSDQTGVRVWA